MAKRSLRNICIMAIVVAMGAAESPVAIPTLDDCDVVWDTPSRDVSGTMPLGNGDIAINTWIQDGDLLFLIGKSDAWDENSINCKLARVRLKFQPNPFEVSKPFRQSLRLRSGWVEIVAGEPGSSTTMRLWVDANRPVIRVESRSEQPVTVQVALETWRNTERTFTQTQVSDLFKNLTGADLYPTIVYPDVVVPDRKDRLLCYHHNRKPQNDGYEINLALQGMEDYAKCIPHPLRGRTFGAAIQGTGLVAVDERTLKSVEPAREHLISVHPLTTLNPDTPESWMSKLDAMIQTTDATPLLQAREAHLAWWSAFWERSWIRLSGDRVIPSATSRSESTSLTITRAYQLCRFMSACAGRGAQPIKFNGSLFTVGKADDPDYRRWGGPGFWFQNQRLLYWPMLAAGDYDLMAPWFRMYREALPFAKARTQTYFKHDGALFGETILFWGAEASGHYGWTPFAKRKSPLCECSYLTYYWQNNLENLAMMLDYFANTGDQTFAQTTLLPHADQVTLFYDLHYQRSVDGKLRFDPAQSLETWHTAVNPLPEIVALKTQMPRLLALPVSLTTPNQRTRWQRLSDDAPAVPTRIKNGKKVLLPAESFSREKNVENPELYGVFPYRLYGVGKPDLQLARDTFAVRKNRQHYCWCQNDTQAALLGLTDEAADTLVERASPAQHKGSRFPAFWQSKYDWIPDVDHGGNLQLALQFMLMQTDGERILLLPAWPKEWDVAFRLHAPGKTQVDCIVRKGAIEKLEVTPRARLKDVVMPNNIR